MLRPKQSDCCVFCSYGSVPCPSMQAEHIERSRSIDQWLSRAQCRIYPTQVQTLSASPEGVIIQTIKSPSGGDKQEKYGRYLGVIWLDGVNVNELLVSKGYAIRREYW